MTNRRPKASSQSAAIPSLTALLAAGAQLAGCHAPLCQSNRAGELAEHGREAITQAREGHAAATLRSLRIATGLTIHPALPRPPVVDVDGGIGMIDPTPEPPLAPTPPTPPTVVSGGIRPTTATPPAPPAPPARPAPPVHPPRRAGPRPNTHFEPHMLGDMGAVLAVPPTRATRRPT